MTDESRTQRMYHLVNRLLQEAPAAPGGGPAQTPAMEALVMFTNGQTIQGSLSVTPEGLLRLLSPGNDPSGRPLLVEQFFDYDAVMVVALTRAITTEVRRIVVPQRSS